MKESPDKKMDVLDAITSVIKLKENQCCHQASVSRVPCTACVDFID